MQCAEYLALSSEFRDGLTKDPQMGEIEAHLASCPDCRRYHLALKRGVDLLRSLPDLDVPDDFKPRLTHRIYHLEDGATISKETHGSGATTLSVMALAVLFAVIAWAPRAGADEPSVELPPVVVGGPPLRTFTPSPRKSTFPRIPSFFTTADFQDGPWGDTHQLLFEYSSLSERRRGPSLSRVGIQ